MTERPPAIDEWLRPANQFKTMRMVECAIVTIVVALVAGATGWLYSGPVAALAVIIALALGCVSAFFILRRVRAWAYSEREQELMVQRGVLVRRLSVVPYGRMQFIDVTAGLAERTFKLATIQLHTAAAATDARIPGLSQQEAQRLRDRLTALGESHLSGL